MVAEDLTAHVHQIEVVHRTVSFGAKHPPPGAAQPGVVVGVSGLRPAYHAPQRRPRIGYRPLPQLRTVDIDRVEHPAPGGPEIGILATGVTVGIGVDPRRVVAGMPPGLIEEVFVHQRIDIQRFERRTHSAEVVASCGKSPFDTASRFAEVALEHRIAAEVSQIAPDIGLAVIAVGHTPDLGIFAVVVQRHEAVAGHGTHERFTQGVGPLLVVVEMPGHLQPHGFGIGLGERTVNMPGHRSEVFGIPARQLHLVERIGPVNVVGAVQTGLLGEKFALNPGEQRVRRAEE